MKYVYPEINHVFNTKSGKVPTLVIENQRLLYRFLNDMHLQLEGGNGTGIVSDENKILPFEKTVELLTEFVPFCINKKTLLSKAAASLERTVMEGDLYGEALELMQRVEDFLLKAAFDLSGDVCFSRICFQSLIKASGLEFREEYDSLPEKSWIIWNW